MTEWHTREQVIGTGFFSSGWLPVETCFMCNSKTLVFAFDEEIGYDSETVKCMDCGQVSGGANWWEALGCDV